MSDGDSYFKSGDEILVVDRNIPLHHWDKRRTLYIFDFEFRVMTVITDYNNSAREASAVHPFPALDTDVLHKMRDKLVELGGKPSPLGALPDRKGAFVAPQSLRKQDGSAKP